MRARNDYLLPVNTTSQIIACPSHLGNIVVYSAAFCSILWHIDVFKNYNFHVLVWDFTCCAKVCYACWCSVVCVS